jgi:hypothetical protein
MERWGRVNEWREGRAHEFGRKHPTTHPGHAAAIVLMQKAQLSPGFQSTGRLMALYTPHSAVASPVDMLYPVKFCHWSVVILYFRSTGVPCHGVSSPVLPNMACEATMRERIAGGRLAMCAAKASTARRKSGL